MPHVILKLWPGKTEEQKKLLAQRMTEVITETLDGKARSVSVSIVEVNQEDWASEVYKKDIMANQDHLYKAPGYTMEIED